LKVASGAQFGRAILKGERRSFREFDALSGKYFVVDM
jgi:hypothetical protein